MASTRLKELTTMEIMTHQIADGLREKNKLAIGENRKGVMLMSLVGNEWVNVQDAKLKCPICGKPDW